jgi:hypothetical protein
MPPSFQHGSISNLGHFYLGYLGHYHFGVTGSISFFSIMFASLIRDDQRKRGVTAA